jgi:hypothetical protein
MAGSVTNGVEPPGSATRDLASLASSGKFSMSRPTFEQDTTASFHNVSNSSHKIILLINAVEKASLNELRNIFQAT